MELLWMMQIPSCGGSGMFSPRCFPPSLAFPFTFDSGLSAIYSSFTTLLFLVSSPASSIFSLHLLLLSSISPSLLDLNLITRSENPKEEYKKLGIRIIRKSEAYSEALFQRVKDYLPRISFFIFLVFIFYYYDYYFLIAIT
jgi:hypothetical protein